MNDVDLVRALARVVREEELAELEYENGSLKIRLVQEREAPAHTFATGHLVPYAPPPQATPAPAAASARPSLPAITSPLAGVFYRSPSPGAPPYVQEGEVVAAGQTLCIVEAMKLMNEITAEASCRILKILLENGQVVEPGQDLFHIEML